MTTLRDRQKLQTANSIRRVAVDLVFENGLDNVTAEMISDKVGISPRTFFNYFSYKEAALLPPTLVISKEGAQIFAAGKGHFLEDLADLIIPMTEFYAENRQMLKKLFEIAQTSPKLSMIRVNAFHDFERMLERVIARRLQLSGCGGNASLMAALITTSLRVAMENWAEDNSGLLDRHIREAFVAMRTAFQT